VSVFSNAEESLLVRTLQRGIVDLIMGPEKNGSDFDWIADAVKLRDDGNARSIAAALEIDAKQAAGAKPSRPLADYAGTWRDPWYGDIVVERRDVVLWLRFTHTPALSGPLEPYDGETFRTRFTDRREEDAFVTFSIPADGPAKATVKGVSPDIDPLQHGDGVAVGALAVGVGGGLGSQGHGAEHHHLAVGLGEQQARRALGAGGLDEFQAARR